MNTNNKKHDNNRNITSIFKLKKKICTLQNIFINIDKYHHSITRNKQKKYIVIVPSNKNII